MQKWITALMVLAAIGAQAVVIDFTDNTEYPVGANLWDHADWSQGGIGASSSATGSVNGIVVGNHSDNDWDHYRYGGENFSTEAIGAQLTSSITFSFMPTSGNGWTELTKTGFRSGSNNSIAYFSRAGNGNYATSEMSLEFGGGQTIFYGSDIGLEANVAGQTTDVLTLIYTITKTGIDTWDGTATILNNDSGFTTNRTVTGLTWADTETAIGVTGNGRPGATNVSSYTITEFTAIPEPATLGMVASFAAGILFIRRRFMM